MILVWIGALIAWKMVKGHVQLQMQMVMENYLMKCPAIVQVIGESLQMLMRMSLIQIMMVLQKKTKIGKKITVQIPMVIIGMTAAWMESVLVILMIPMEMKMEQRKTLNGIEVRVMRRMISMTMMIYLAVQLNQVNTILIGAMVLQIELNFVLKVKIVNAMGQILLKIGIVMKSGMMQRQQMQGMEFGMTMRVIQIQVKIVNGTPVNHCI